MLIKLRREKEKIIRRLAQDEQARRRVRARLLLKHDGRMARPNVAGRACRLARTRRRPQRQVRQPIRETETSSEVGKTRSGLANVDKSNQVRERSKAKAREHGCGWMRRLCNAVNCRAMMRMRQ